MKISLKKNNLSNKNKSPPHKEQKRLKKYQFFSLDLSVLLLFCC